MAMVTTETVNGYAIRPSLELDRGRKDSRIVLPKNMDVISPTRNHADFPRSASYTYLGDTKNSPYTNPQSVVTIKGAFTRQDSIASTDELVDISPPESSGSTTPDEPLQFDTRTHARQPQDLVEELRKSPKISHHNYSSVAENNLPAAGSHVIPQSVLRPSLDSVRTTNTVASAPSNVRSRQGFGNAFSKAINRSSWYGASSSASSRSPSPVKTDNPALQGPGSDGQSATTTPPVQSKKSMLRKKISSRSLADKSDGEESVNKPNSISRRPTFLKKRPNRLSRIFKGPQNDGSAPLSPLLAPPPIPFLPKSFSTDKLPMTKSQAGFPDRAAPMPRLLSDDRSAASSLLTPKKKDELWSVFRSLDGDYTKFVSKSVALKANVVRSSLIPFLRQYATHPSNKTLRPEDLDRRAHILNKWWTGLIEMLHGRNNQSISGTDRPTILDGISGIMERPEWRLSPSLFCPLIERTKGTSSPLSRSTTSLATNASEFLAESVHHNIRNIFVQNLSAQMAFVVDKMSLRNASASLVTFCGKACAYAFMFVPGMADVLIRLWDIPMDTMRRVLVENGIEKFDDLSDITPDIVSGFPPALHQLGFSSLMGFTRKLRVAPPLPLGTQNVQWWGHWLERWSGRDSDLFYVFVKHFHILSTDFLLPATTKKERMCAPGVLSVHAQILTNLEATIHRDANPDAVATALPLPPTNAVRIMAENRLIMLIRDFLSERTADHPIARLVFAESFNDLLQAAARGTSVFDHAGCYVLLDFLEEAFLILVRYEHMKETEGTLINSEFWQSAFKAMIGSQNTMTEIRLYAFLYTVWNTVVCDLGRKADFCLGLLLDPEVFESRFNHWCPMVRAYFMRLLCWRVGRFDGESNLGEDAILETMLFRLQSIWSQYLWFREQAARNPKFRLATNPSHPAPGRRLLIIRTDPQLTNSRSFLSYDGIKSPPISSNGLSRRISTMSTLSALETPPGSPFSASSAESVEVAEKGVSGFLKKMWSSKSSSKVQDLALTPSNPASSPALSETTTRGRAATDSQVSLPRPSPLDLGVKATELASVRNFTFRFSLEFHPNNRNVLPNMRLLPPRLPLPAHSHLQSISELASPSHPFMAHEPTGESRARAKYCGRALAEWTLIVSECQGFFERRKNEGIPNNKLVETPVLGVEVFRRPS
ncbi:Hypothetical protein R9X50_00488400 [Acrodontium crateriforme]|uniref:DUF1765-domain-containing protein n=1 Tax=Acrodontium crateriforme TaxID=150365 RepID=A0AAQ3M5E4_9PEZI|nr:Hypothetical protein R9X50_00488400 [Acrodontium crateriforme]